MKVVELEIYLLKISHVFMFRLCSLFQFCFFMFACSASPADKKIGGVAAKQQKVFLAKTAYSHESNCLGWYLDLSVLPILDDFLPWFWLPLMVVIRDMSTSIDQEIVVNV